MGFELSCVQEVIAEMEGNKEGGEFDIFSLISYINRVKYGLAVGFKAVLNFFYGEVCNLCFCFWNYSRVFVWSFTLTVF